MSKKAYETGVVIIVCDGCQAKHLIADHLGWFDTVKKEGTIEDIIKRRGGDRDGNQVVRLRAAEVLNGGEGEVEEGSTAAGAEGEGEGEEGLMEWLPRRADEAALRRMAEASKGLSN
ncbi:hypothetical protein HDU81_000491 [Chytriomyces hyalinus]|nr:hypothetical protein HDU81_000491 [Chytriomyces hyalinus]